MKAIFFDLDGTLVDTSDDLIQAAQYALGLGEIAEYKRQLQQKISRGFKGIASALVDVESIDYEAAHEKFLEHYKKNISRHSRFYQPLDKLLMYLSEHSIPHGVVTNKSTYLAKQLFGELLPSWDGVLVGSDLQSHSKLKPAPDSLLDALVLMQQKYQLARTMDANEVYYVGDYPTDIEAAKSAKWRSIAVAYGFLPEHPPIHEWQADLVIETPQGLSAWVRNNIQ